MEKVLTMLFSLKAANIIAKAAKTHPHGISMAVMRFQ